VRGDDLAAEAELFKNKAIAILLDTKTATAKGGSGVVFDWNVVNTLDFPVSINNFYL
jgi:phosphoribosylanthranilate isomerase